jgi:hypothetical protein
MNYLSNAAQHLIKRIDNNLIFGIIQNLGFCLQSEEPFFLPTAKLQVAWFELEIEMLSLQEKLHLIKDLSDQARKNLSLQGRLKSP